MDRQARLEAYEAAVRPVVLPSLLACDFARMDRELNALAEAGAAAVHLDVMDGRFVPNLSYGAPVIARWREASNLKFDAHLMIEDPARYADDFEKAGCDRLMFHIEVVPDPTELLRRIRRSGCRAGLVLNPPTPVDAIRPYLAEADTVLVMSVMPGFGGQAFQPETLDKVRAIHKARPGLPIGIDGGINPATARSAIEAGVTELVAGSAVFRSGRPYAEALAELAGGRDAPGPSR